MSRTESSSSAGSKIILIVGLPASGKTHLAKSLNPDILIDDPKNFGELIGHDFKLMVVTDPFLCYSELRKEARRRLLETYPDVDIEFLFYENNPTQCKKNASSRPDKPVEKFIEMLSKIYNPPYVDKGVWKEPMKWQKKG